MSLLSPLNEQHKALGATFTDFSGWQMPLHYGSILKEHLHVRESVGLFDISHMGAVFISGRESAVWLNKHLANDIGSLAIEQAHHLKHLNKHHNHLHPQLHSQKHDFSLHFST